jgi:hypothetical protein
MHISFLKYYISLTSIVIFNLSVLICASANKDTMRLDLSKYDWRCNDFVDRMMLKISILDEDDDDDNTSNNMHKQVKKTKDEKFILKYKYSECQENCESELYNLTMFDRKVSFIKFKFNSYFQYELYVTKIKYSSENVPKQKKKVLKDKKSADNDENEKDEASKKNEEVFVCANLGYVKFLNCDQYLLTIYSNQTCSLKLFDSGAPLSQIRYFYIVIMAALGITVLARLAKVFFNKYRMLR